MKTELDFSLPGEEWKPYKGDKPWIKVSNLGRTYSSRGGGKLLGERGLPEKPLQLIKTHFPWDWIKNLEDGEECCEIKGSPGYFITNRGRVFSFHGQKWKKLRRHHNKSCFYYWSVKLPGRSYVMNHTLVGRHFLDWEEELLVLHKEETLSPPEVYSVENLWLGTSKDNSLDRERKGRGRWKP